MGRGDQINLWYDPWINGNAPNPYRNLLSNSGLHERDTVSAILQNSSWSLPHNNHHEIILFRRLIEAIPIRSDSADCILWHGVNVNSIKARHVWDNIRDRTQQVGWHDIVWNNLSVPRYSFILWLGFLKKLQTNDINKHYSGRVFACPLCQQLPETFDHLFFVCDYSQAILGAALRLGDWNNIPMN